MKLLRSKLPRLRLVDETSAAAVIVGEKTRSIANCPVCEKVLPKKLNAIAVSEMSMPVYSPELLQALLAGPTQTENSWPAPTTADAGPALRMTVAPVADAVMDAVVPSKPAIAGDAAKVVMTAAKAKRENNIARVSRY